MDFFNRKWKNSLSELSKNRKFNSRNELLKMGIDIGLDVKVVAEVIDFIYDYLPKVEGFSIDFNDDLLSDYEIDPEDLGDFYEETILKLNGNIPSRTDQDNYSNKKKGESCTVKDVCHFLSWCLDCSK
jgi:hypothetical protein